MQNLSDIEKERNIQLPKVYKDFFYRSSKKMPEGLIGSDFLNVDQIQNWAVELLQENNVSNFLGAKDFVFLMHQGYQFYYFTADGTLNPIVYRYYEGKGVSTIGSLATFLGSFQVCA